MITGSAQEHARILKEIILDKCKSAGLRLRGWDDGTVIIESEEDSGVGCAIYESDYDVV
jgi:hypothetical protein